MATAIGVGIVTLGGALRPVLTNARVVGVAGKVFSMPPGGASGSRSRPEWLPCEGVLHHAYPAKGSCIMSESSRSGLVLSSTTGASANSSMRRMYFTASAGNAP